MSNPVVSVIIPTHERAKYAIPTIRLMLSLHCDIEVVVCDSSSEDRITPELRGTTNLSRLRLIRPGKVLSIVDNFNTALAAATGKYLTIIGDDDFVSEDIVTVANWAEKNQIDSIKFSFPTCYYWPDFHHKTRGNFFAGTLRTRPFTGKVIQHDAKAASLNALANFGRGVMEMPRAYAGLVSMDLVKRIQQKYGALFGGVSPDIYSSFLISQEARKCVYIDYPIIIPGSSGLSAAGQSANGKHVGKLRDNAHIRPFNDLEWHPLIPEFYSVPTVWSFSLLKAVEKHGEHIDYVNFPSLYLKCLLFHNSYSSETLKSIRYYRQQKFIKIRSQHFLGEIVNDSIWMANKIKARIFDKMGSGNQEKVTFNISNTIEAAKAVKEQIEKQVNLTLPVM
jgi:glycosyltransferase involved in cell wall biosynthesis